MIGELKDAAALPRNLTLAMLVLALCFAEVTGVLPVASPSTALALRVSSALTMRPPMAAQSSGVG